LGTRARGEGIRALVSTADFLVPNLGYLQAFAFLLILSVKGFYLCVPGLGHGFDFGGILPG
jgi:hypothetical protein